MEFGGAISILQEEWKPTMRLRWHLQDPSAPNELQQLWIDIWSDKTEWRPVPTE